VGTDTSHLEYNWDIGTLHRNHYHPGSYEATGKSISLNLGSLLNLGDRNTLEIHLTAKNSNGTVVHDVISAIPCTLSNQPPIASFSLEIIGSDEDGMSIRVNGLSSSDPDLDRLTFEWDWGDGFFSNQAFTTTHTYLNKGSYQVKLTVRDVMKGEAIAVKTVKEKGHDVSNNENEEEDLINVQKSNVVLHKSDQVQTIFILVLFICVTIAILVKAKLLPPSIGLKKFFGK